MTIHSMPRKIGAPHLVVDRLVKLAGVKNDRQLCKMLGVATSCISKIRHGKSDPGNPYFILNIHEKLGIPVVDIRQMIEEHNAKIGNRHEAP